MQPLVLLKSHQNFDVYIYHHLWGFVVDVSKNGRGGCSCPRNRSIPARFSAESRFYLNLLKDVRGPGSEPDMGYFIAFWSLMI